MFTKAYHLDEPERTKPVVTELIVAEPCGESSRPAGGPRLSHLISLQPNDSEQGIARADGFRSDYLGRFSSSVAETIPEVEAALVAGSIDDVLARPQVLEVLGPTLAGRYKKIADHKVRHDQTFRQNWVKKFIAALQSLMQDPVKRFPAESATTRPFQELANGHVRPSAIRVKHRDEIIVLRPSQVISARRWNIWFEFDDESLDRAYDDFLVHVARQELSSNIQSLWNLETTYLSGRSGLELNPEWSFGHRGEFFEHLVLDVLNESTSVAKRANLAEDILEKTDLRVTFPSLNRRRGARVQVSITADRAQQDRKTRDWHLPDEIVVLTPVELAAKALSPPKTILFDKFPWDVFWESFGSKYWSEETFAQELHQLFVDSFSFATAHPLGPMWLLPKPLREFIRIFVEASAIETTRRLREREQSSFRWRGSSEKFTTSYWINKFSKQSSEETGQRTGDHSYSKIVIHLSETICITSEIDKVIREIWRLACSFRSQWIPGACSQRMIRFKEAAEQIKKSGPKRSSLGPPSQKLH